MFTPKAKKSSLKALKDKTRLGIVEDQVRKVLISESQKLIVMVKS